MALLFAHIEYQIRQISNTVGRAIVEKCTGFSDPTGRQLPADEPCDWQRDLSAVPAEAAEDHRGYYEVTPTCGQVKTADVDVTHGCYRDPGHDGDHGCLCGHTWSAGGYVGAMKVVIDENAPQGGLAGTSTVPAGVSAEDSTSPVPPAGLTWPAWAVPAICDVLADHQPRFIEASGYVDCCQNSQGFSTHAWPDEQAWRDHVAPLIAERLDTAWRAKQQREDLGPAVVAADELIAAALRVAGFRAVPAICSAIFNHK